MKGLDKDGGPLYVVCQPYKNAEGCFASITRGQMVTVRLRFIPKPASR